MLPAGLTAEQATVMAGIDRAIVAGDRTHVIQGIAGVGKTHLLCAVARRHPTAEVCALSNRAAALLRHKTGRPARTIHRLVKRFIGLDRHGDPLFDRNNHCGELVLVDEASVVNAELAADLQRNFDTVIAFGDPAQLQPVQGLPGFPRANAVLSEIHRQAQGNPIIRQAHAVRNGRGYTADGPEFRVKAREELTYGDLSEADIALTYFRDSRAILNSLMREARGITGVTLKAGEPVMSTKNYYDNAIFNGEIWYVVKDCALGHDPLTISDGRETQTLKNVAVEGLWTTKDPDAIQFRLAYAQTVHASQGSEWSSVLLLNQKPKNPQWVYTGITRASQRVLVVEL